MERVNLLGNASWQLLTLRRTLSNLVFYFDVPGDETGTDGWVNATRRDVQQCFAAAIDTGAIDRDTLVARRSDALSLISILNHNPGTAAKDAGANAQSRIRKLVELCEQLASIEHAASDEAERNSEPEGANEKTPSGMTWQGAQEQLERFRQNGEQYTSQRKMSERIGCNPAVVVKAIERGPLALQEWASKKSGAASRKVVATIEGQILNGTPQNREADPADILDDDDVDRAMRLLMEQAEPNERARINAMTPADRRVLAELAYNDPDADERIMSSKRRR